MRQLIFMLGIAVVLPISQKSEAPADAILAKEVTPCRIEQFGVYNALGEISEKAGIGIGVDAVQPDHEPTVAFDFPGGTVLDLLNMFVSRVPDYEWHESLGQMIHVSRRGAHVPILDVRLSLEGSRKKTRQQISEGLSSIPEIADWLSSNHCTRDQFTQGGEFRTHNDSFSISTGSYSLQEFLDEIAAKSGTNYWAVLLNYRDGACRLSILM